MQKLQVSGAIAGARGALWRVERIESHGRRQALVHLARPDEAGLARGLVAVRPAEPLAAVQTSGALRPVRVRDALQLVAHARGLERVAFAAHAADRLNGAVLAWQLAAALAFARGHSRVLLADAVGMGKTVSAAIAIAECLGAHSERRVLVVAPGHLIAQWRAELAVRVGIEAAIADAAGVRRAERELPAGTSAWARPGCAITSIDFVKQPHVARAVEPIVWDLVVIDEAHAVCGLSERHAAADLIARRARRLLLVTATPSDGGVERFRALTSLGSAGDPMVMLRRTQPPQAGRGPVRERTLRVTPGAGTAALHRALGDYAASIAAAPRGAAPAVSLLATLLVKRALSSAHALRISLERRLELIGTDAVATQPSLFASEDDPGVLGAASGMPVAQERARLESLIALAARAAGGDRRLGALDRLIARTRETAVIFTCFRDTAELVFARLSRAHDARLVHGQLPPAVGSSALAAFADGPARVLVATDVAAEGLNLHQRCRWVIHYDLPWRPSTVRQRSGRVDRLGQPHRAHATLLVDRTELSRQMTERMAALAARMRSDERESAARWRVLAAREAARVQARRAAAPVALRAVPRGTVHVVEMDLVDEAGASVDRAVMAAHGDADGALAMAAARAERRSAAIGRRLAVRAARRIARERAVAAAALETIASTLVQGGLFDRRALRTRDAGNALRTSAAAALRAAIAGHLRASRLQAARVRVIAAFTKDGGA